MTLGELNSRLQQRFYRTRQAHQYASESGLSDWFDSSAPVEVYHLPHPSGASTWLNYPQNKALLEQALFDLKLKFGELFQLENTISGLGAGAEPSKDGERL